MSGKIERAALGRVAKIGALYDIRTDTFTGDYLFTSSLTDDDVDGLKRTNVEIDLVVEDNLQAKLDKMKIDADLKVSVMAGFVKLSGSGAYLTEERESDKTQRMSLIYKLKTYNESIYLRRLRKKVATEIFHGKQTTATHAVCEIDWGAMCSITCECQIKDEDQATEISGELEAEINKLKNMLSASGSAGVSYESTSQSHRKSFTFKCKSDVVDIDQKLPDSFEGAVDFARNMPRMIKDTEGGKGVPLVYHLKPLDEAAQECGIDSPLEIISNAIKGGTISSCLQVMEDIASSRHSLRYLQKELLANKGYVTKDALHEVKGRLKEFTQKDADFRGELQRLIREIRSGEEDDTSKLDDFLGKQVPEILTIDHKEHAQKSLRKAKFAQSCQTKGIHYIRRDDDSISIGNLLEYHHDTKQTNTIMYIFYKQDDDGEEEIKNEPLFMSLHKNANKEEIFVIVDRELRPDLWVKEEIQQKSAIWKYINGATVSKDVYADTCAESAECLIQINTRSLDTTTKCPSERAAVRIKCPKSWPSVGYCANHLVSWKCNICKTVIEYVKSTRKLYCQCGMSSPKGTKWRCSEGIHGDYIAYNDDYLYKQLESLRPIKEYNILILGETGVGKSTWINSFANYLRFSNLEEAQAASKPTVLIPFCFNVDITNSQGEIENRQVSMGNGDSNEKVGVKGESATQGTRAYSFKVEVGGQQVTIRLIDTPGVGDCRGIQKDAENFENILSYLGHFKELHTVCILLKANQSRLTTTFNFCIQELLAHLHNSVKDNIVFCFTNSRAAFYHPGSTVEILKEALNKRNIGLKVNNNNCFCFDNEAFRFLAALKCGVPFTDDDVLDYTASWNKSVNVSTFLIEHIINNMIPHQLHNTFSINNSRRLIVAMSKPLAEIVHVIGKNIKNLDKAREKSNHLKGSREELDKTLKYTMYKIEYVGLDHPITVCGHEDCVERVEIPPGPDEQTASYNTHYKTKCHDPCKLEGIPTQTYNDKRLKECAGILGAWEDEYHKALKKPDAGEKCANCGHAYWEHMHITYTTEIVKKVKVNTRVLKELQEVTSEEDRIEIYKNDLDQTIKEQQEEKKIITKTSATFAVFLEQNAMVAYNDATLQYLDMQIEMEQNIPEILRKPGDSNLKSLKKHKEEYQEQVRILEKEMKEAKKARKNGKFEKGTELTPEVIDKLKEDLFDLKHNGDDIRKLITNVQRSNNKSVTQSEHIVRHIPIQPEHSDKNALRKMLNSLFGK